LVVVNCAAVPDTLFESELFGHLRGAFTGATEARRGKFQQADGGTLFLDEVGEIPPALQPKLLRAVETGGAERVGGAGPAREGQRRRAGQRRPGRAVETGEVERIGGQAPERVDVRVVAATNRDLAAEVAAGRFRGDLYYRLLVAPITLPPLREREEDIAALAK